MLYGSLAYDPALIIIKLFLNVEAKELIKTGGQNC